MTDDAGDERGGASTNGPEGASLDDRASASLDDQGGAPGDAGVSRRRVLEGAAATGLAGLASAGPAVAAGCDLTVTKTRDGGFPYGGQGTYLIEVCNVGADPCTRTVTVTDGLPAGLSFVSASGTGWTASASGGTVTLTHPNDAGLAPGECLPDVALTVAVADRADFPSGEVTNCATVHAGDDVNPANDRDCDTVCIADSVTFQGGTEDLFDGSTEPTDPDSNLQDKLDSYGGGQRDFDEGDDNKVFGHTFDLFPDDSLGAICGAELRVRLRPERSGLEYNDHFVLGFFDGSGLGWRRFIGDQPNGGEDGLFDFEWETNNSATDTDDGHELTLQLDSLPLEDGGSQDMLPALNQKGSLDVFVQDDTAVDFVELTVTYCCDSTVEPCDLVVDKRESAGFTARGTGQYEVVVSNVGEADCKGPITVSDDLPDGMTFDGASGSGWTVTSSGSGGFTAAHPGPVPGPGSLPPLTVDVTVDGVRRLPDVPRLENCVTVSAPGDSVTTNNTDCAVTDCVSGRAVVRGGVHDDFDDSDPEPAAPRDGLAEFIDNNYGTRREFDDDGSDAAFGHSFTDLRPTDLLGEICGATLHVRLRPESFLANNDRIRLGFFESSGAVGDRWGRSIGDLAGVEWRPATAGATTFRLDLESLDNGDGTTTDLLAAVKQRGFLDLYVQDDTAVDFAHLELQYCCPDEPTGECEPTVEKELVSPAHFGHRATYRIDVCNAGDGACLGPIEVVDELPDGVTFASATGSGWTVVDSADDGVILEHPGPLLAGECLPSPTVTVDVGPESDFGSVPALVENCVELETVTGSTQACLQHDVTVEQCDLDIRKRVAEPFEFGGTGAYVVEVVNNGDGVCEKSVTVSDVLPDGVQLVDAGGEGWSVQLSESRVVANTEGALEPGEALPPLVIDVTVASEEAFPDDGTIQNCAVLELPDGSETACVTHTID